MTFIEMFQYGKCETGFCEPNPGFTGAVRSALTQVEQKPTSRPRHPNPSFLREVARHSFPISFLSRSAPWSTAIRCRIGVFRAESLVTDFRGS